MMPLVGIDWAELVFAAGILGLVGFAAHTVHRLPKVWRGETLLSLPYRNFFAPEVNHRSFPAFTGFIAALGGGALLVSIGMLTGITDLTGVGGLAMVVGVLVFVPLWILVNAVNRPRFLVPPARRQEPGWWGEWRARRRRRSEGLAPTDHVVEILDVRPPPEERKSYEPYFVAVCGADDCGWTSAPVGRDEAHPDPEQVVRDEAKTHSSTMTGPRRPLG
jgi:hypothetical protein